MVRSDFSPRQTTTSIFSKTCPSLIPHTWQHTFSRRLNQTCKMAPFVGRLGEFQARALKLFLDAIERERAKKHGEPIYNFSHDRERRAFLQRICDESNSWLFKRVQEFTKDAIMFGRLLEHINEFGVIVDHSGCSQKDHCGTKCFYRRGLNLLKPRAIRRLAELPLDTGDFSPSSMLPLKPLKHDSEGLVGSMAVGDYRRRSSRIFELVCASEHAVPTGGNGEDTPLLSITKRRKTRLVIHPRLQSRIGRRLTECLGKRLETLEYQLPAK